MPDVMRLSASRASVSGEEYHYISQVSIHGIRGACLPIGEEPWLGPTARPGAHH